MVSIEDYGQYETAWCPGCGNFSILEAVKQGLVDSGIAPHEVLLVSGIGTVRVAGSIEIVRPKIEQACPSEDAPDRLSTE